MTSLVGNNTIKLAAMSSGVFPSALHFSSELSIPGQQSNLTPVTGLEDTKFIIRIIVQHET